MLSAVISANFQVLSSKCYEKIIFKRFAGRNAKTAELFSQVGLHVDNLVHLFGCKISNTDVVSEKRNVVHSLILEAVCNQRDNYIPVF